MADTIDELKTKTCKPCEGGVAPMTAVEAEQQIEALDDWSLSADGKAIGKDWTLKDFAACLAAIQTIGEVAEREDHHPDLLLHGYKNLRVTLSTHAISGLSENDFIVAAKVDDALSGG